MTSILKHLVATSILAVGLSSVPALAATTVSKPASHRVVSAAHVTTKHSKRPKLSSRHKHGKRHAKANRKSNRRSAH